MTSRLDQTLDLLERGCLDRPFRLSVVPPDDEEGDCAGKRTRSTGLRHIALAVCGAGQAAQSVLGSRFRHSLGEVRRLVEIGLRAKRLIRPIGQVEEVVERGPATKNR